MSASFQAMLKVRLDKWLWAARFFKTRAQAKKAIVSGKILVDGLRIKPAREITKGVTLRIRKDNQVWEVRVDDLSSQRGSAPVAQDLYTETADSVEQRELARLQQKSWSNSYGARPTAKERRQAILYRQKVRSGFRDTSEGLD
jgi:ribosome-associated heat shock protein Hsp15